jgi:hypothetical protein
MTEAEAIERANKYVWEHQHIATKPVEVHLVQRAKLPAYWWVSFGTSVYYPSETAAGEVIDDGAYIVKVDDMTGKVSVLK